MAAIRQFKEKHAYVLLDHQEEPPKYATFSSSQNNIEIERALCAELHFDTMLISRELEGLHQLVYDSVMACSIDIRREMFSNIILAGGTTMLPGLQQRLQKEIATLVPASVETNVIARDIRSYSAFRGAYTLVNAPGFGKGLVTKDEYDEGPRIITRRVF